MRKFMGSVDLRQIYTPIGQMAIFVAGAGALCSVIMIILALLCRGSGADQVLQATQGVGIFTYTVNNLPQVLILSLIHIFGGSNPCSSTGAAV